MRDPSPIPSLGSHSRWTDLLVGLALPFRAFGLLLKTPRLRRLSFLAAVITSGTLLGLAVSLWPLASTLADRWVGHDGAWEQATAFGLTLLLFVVGFVLGALTLPNLVLAPLQDPLSEATEVLCGDFSPTPFSWRGVVRGTIESLSHTLLRLTLMLGGLVALAPLNLIPAAGSVLWVVASGMWGMFWLSVEHLSNPMSRHFYPFRGVVRALWGRLPLALGLGAALSVVLWVPVLDFFLMPVAVVSGTLLFRGLRAVEAIGPERTRQAGNDTPR